MVDLHPIHRHPQPARSPLPAGACFKSTARAHTRELREPTNCLMLSGGLGIRKAADGVGMHYRPLYGWVLAAGRSRRKPAQ